MEQETGFAPAETTPLWLHRCVFFVACCTLLLVSAGGFVTSLGAGLAVPDWPLSFGSVNPEGWLGLQNVRAEHGHRLIAGTVGLMTLGLWILCLFHERRKWVRRFAGAAFAIVVAQALLGGLTVLWGLPDAVSIAHGMLGQTFFCVLVALALFTSHGWSKSLPVAREQGIFSTRHLCVALVAVVFMQLFFGALMRHTGSGLAIPDFPLAYGGLWPRLDETSIHNYNVDRFYAGLPDVHAGNIASHYIHRVWAAAVALAALLAGVSVFKRHIHRAELLFPTLGVGVLIVFQIILGGWTVLSGKHPYVATAHVAVGAVILALSVILAIQSLRVSGAFADARARAEHEGGSAGLLPGQSIDDERARGAIHSSEAAT